MHWGRRLLKLVDKKGDGGERKRKKETREKRKAEGSISIYKGKIKATRVRGE
jgi:hypothetical protein